MPIRAAIHAADRSTDFPRTFLLAPGSSSTLFRHLETKSAGGVFEIAHEWKNASLRGGTDVDRASIKEDYAGVSSAGQRGAVVATVDAHRDQTAFFATGDWQALEHLRLSAGLRRDDIHDEHVSTSHRSSWSPRLTATLHLGPARDPYPLVVFLQVARAFKAPTLDQLFDPRPFPGPKGTPFTRSNPSLLPQRARNAEAGRSRSTAGPAWTVNVYP